MCRAFQMKDLNYQKKKKKKNLKENSPTKVIAIQLPSKCEIE